MFSSRVASTYYCFYYFFLIFTAIKVVEGSSGTPNFFRHTPNSIGPSPHNKRRPTISSLSPRSQRYIHSVHGKRGNLNHHPATVPPRGGQGIDQVVRVVSAVTQILIECGNLVLPPVVAITRFVVRIYRALPKDALVAQVGLVYCFAGGYYPTLFSSLQAAQQYGWNVMIEAIQDLADEALAVIQVLEDTAQLSADDVDLHKPCSFRQTASIVLATVDPTKINVASGALYTTWMGVSSVLQREYARVITLSLTMAHYIERVAVFLLAPPAYLCVPEEYHRWIPVVIGWGCKAVSMNIAWRLQRVMTAATSAVTGGILFARAVSRMIWKRKANVKDDVEGNHRSTVLDEIIGFMVAGLGFYTQFESQWRSGFSFRVPFPISLVTWPFDLAENWIQWQITK